MGQYWIPVNLDKREYVEPAKLGSAYKLRNLVYTGPGPGAALVILCAAGAGNALVSFLNPDPIIGRWAGDRIAIISDYTRRSDLPNPADKAEIIYELCQPDPGYPNERPFTDVTDAVVSVIERVFNGKYAGTEWDRRFEPNAG